MHTLYDFKLLTLNEQPLNLGLFRGKVLLIVNTASRCGFTPQYEGLERLYKKYQHLGLEIIACPCNQFGAQESGSASEIGSFCQKNYGVSFTVSEKLKVNGADAHPLWRYLKQEKRGFLGFSRIKWNFTKFLINTEGDVVARFAPYVTPDKIEAHIVRLLKTV